MQRDVGDCRWQRAHGHGFPSEAPTGETDLESFDAPTAVAPGTLMTGAHSPWPLFCNDLDQAQQWVSDQLARSPTDTKLGHQALSLGLTDAVRQLLNQGNLNLEDATQRQWKFRLARLSGAKNPYAELIPPDMQTFTDLQMDHARRMGVPAVVSLRGGIGDHLEMISMLLEWSRIDAHPLILQVTPQRQKALAPLDRVHPPTCAAKQHSSAGGPGHGDAGMDLQALWIYPLWHLDHEQAFNQEAN